MNRADWTKAINDAVYEAAKDRAKNMAMNEISEGGETADDQFEKTVAELNDAHARMLASIDKIFKTGESS
jgi:hypothetical protein